MKNAEVVQMANPISGVSNAQHAAQVAQSAQTAKQQTPPRAAAPQDTVNISQAGRAASQAQQTQQPSGDLNHDGDTK
jgi:hypothetical protein